MNLDQRIMLCKQNRYEMNILIDKYKPFIASIVQKQLGRFVEYGKDDELSIGLIAFEEAVRAYDNTKGAFLSFAQNVIKRRLIDYFRKEMRYKNVIPLSSLSNPEEQKEYDPTQSQSMEIFNHKEESEYRKYEIVEIQKELKSWDISFFDLPQVSPKHIETKKLYAHIVDTIINNKELLIKMKVKKYLPVAEIEKLTGIHRKKIERARKYVIALIIILTGDYNYIQSFIKWR